jgi:RNA ligase
MFTFEQALEAVKNKPEFGVYERPWGHVVDYNLTTYTTFVGDTPEHENLLRNLRGTCFDHSGKIIRLAFHKFENLGQSEDYMPEKFDFSSPHRIEQKLDGSMITPIMVNGILRLATRAGVTDVAMMAEEFLHLQMTREKRHSYVSFMERCVRIGWTPMFEFCSRQNRVVIDHPESKLVLIGIRENATGRYLDTHGVAIDRNIEKVKVVANEHSDINKFAEYIKTLKDDEGVVVKFADGRYVKIKADEYCLRHRTLDGLRFEKDVLKMVLSGILDDVLPLVDEGTKARLNAYNDSVLKHIAIQQLHMTKEFGKLQHLDSKKDFAEAVKNSKYRSGLFRLFDGKEYELSDIVLNKCGSSTDVESVRWLIGPDWYSF